MRLYQSGALLTGAGNEIIRLGGILVNGPRIVAAGPLDALMAEHPIPPDMVDLGARSFLGIAVAAATASGMAEGPRLLAAAGPLTPAVEILDAATARAARALGVDDRTGTIEPGKDADLIAVRGGPRTDISVLNHLELVAARGAEYRPAPHRDQRPAGPPPADPAPGAPAVTGPAPAVAGPAAPASALATPAGPSPR